MTPKYPRSPKSNFWSKFGFLGFSWGSAGVQLAKTGCSPSGAAEVEETAATAEAGAAEIEATAATAEAGVPIPTSK